MSDFSNEDFLSALRQAQDSARRQEPGNFDEYRDETRLNKSPRSGGTQSSLAHFSPGFGLMGHLNTNSRAPSGPPNRPNGNNVVGLKQTPQQFGIPAGASINQVQSQYSTERIAQPLPWIDDVDMANLWYSPFQPVWPFGPPYYNVPREWNFPVGYNLNFIPQRLELMSMLRGMRSSWGVLATVIETRKDQLLRLPWTIQVRNRPRASSKAVDEMRKFFRRPDGKLTYSQWTRRYLDDLFVIDAPTIFFDRNQGGKVTKAEILDGAGIFPLIDDVGRRPDTEYTTGPDGIVYQRRQPAFQQIIYGLPMINLSEDEILYGMMRPTPELPVFGYSQVQQIYTEATEAIRKTYYTAEFWRSGSIPDLMITVPENWSPRQLATFQAHFDALLSGQLTLKSKVRFIPGGMKPFDIKNASGESLWSQRDELLVRLVCYAFSISPTPFIHQVNRATANQAQEAADQEGLFPLMAYWKDDVMDTIIQEKFGYDDVEFSFLPIPEPDQQKLATIHDLALKSGQRSINEVRGEQGLEPLVDGDQHLIYLGSTVLRLEDVVAGKILAPGQPAPNAETQPKPPTGSAASNVPIKGAARPSVESPAPPTPVQTSGQTPVRKTSAKALDLASARADQNPSELKQKIGNYPKGHLSLRGLKITIENAKGSKRKEKDRFGQDQAVKMPAAYGYIRQTLGADNMQVDCYIGKHLESDKVFVIDQDKFSPSGEDKGFDEHKVMFGYNNPAKAIRDYMRSHFDNQGRERLSALTVVTFDALKSWLKNGDMKTPISEQEIGQVIGRRGKGNGISKLDTINQSTGLLHYDLTSSRKRKKRRKQRRNQRLNFGPKWLNLVEN